jgi:hypothetical protein
MARMAAQPQPVPPGRHEAGLRTQLRCLSLRLLRNSYRHPFLISVNLLANLGMALLVASVFYDAGLYPASHFLTGILVARSVLSQRQLSQTW